MFRIFSVAFLVLVASALAAQAGLTICNETDSRKSVAIAYAADDSWTSEGWWNIDSGECSLVLSGDLSNRYYYYRATSGGEQFNKDDVEFCTEPTVFEISGDISCAMGGYDSSPFEKIDTGQTAREFTLRLVNQDAPAPRGDNADLPEYGTDQNAGRFGEPYQASGYFQGCDIEDGAEYCAWVIDGMIQFAYPDAGTAPELMHALESFPINTPMTVWADLVAVYDATTELVVRGFSYADGFDPYINIRDDLQGQWLEEGGEPSSLFFYGARQYAYYDGELVGDALIEISDSCDVSNGEGPVLIVTQREDPEDNACYLIESSSWYNLHLVYLPRGVDILYRKDG